jgi:hypothetical protein
LFEGVAGRITVGERGRGGGEDRRRPDQRARDQASED